MELYIVCRGVWVCACAYLLSEYELRDVRVNIVASNTHNAHHQHNTTEMLPYVTISNGARTITCISLCVSALLESSDQFHRPLTKAHYCMCIIILYWVHI